MQVLVRARVGLYEARGEFQLIVEHMEEAGDGALRRAFDRLKRKLDEAGLFDLAHKQALPVLPQRIGVITSPSGAAIHDILTTLRRRFPGIPVLVYPVPVQGADAAREIARMIRLAGDRKECDVLILARGGGSLEDLQAFNEEMVARAIHACPIPLVTGIGHEVDLTIADLVADQRAPTPTAAAELVTPDQAEWRARLEKLQQRLLRARQRQFEDHRQRLQWLARRLPRPARRIEEHLQRLDELELRRNQAMQHILRHHRSRLAMLRERLQQFSPRQRLERHALLLRELSRRARRAMQDALARPRQRLAHLAHSLDTVSPLATLSRGYAIVTLAGTDRIVRTASEVAPGDRIQARLHEGKLIAAVTGVIKK